MRAAELGGTCVVESPQGPSGRGGTRVRASLPYGGLAELGERPRGPEPVPAPAGREE